MSIASLILRFPKETFKTKKKSVKTKKFFDGFGGIACGPLVPNIAGSNPTVAFGFFGRKNPQHAFLRRGSKAVCPMSQLCGM
jgi:hypothetical protein